jgi:hypothetical protein
MRIASRWTAALLLSVAAAAVALAQAPSLDVKMGLWEVTSTTDLSGQMPAMDTSKMTPDQRAQMETMMKAMAGRPTVTKICMTKEKLDRSSFMTEQPGTTCTQALTTNTSSTLEATVSCKGGRAATSKLHIDALSSTSIKGSFAVSNIGDAGRGMNINATMTGQWLGADCGTTK